MRRRAVSISAGEAHSVVVTEGGVAWSAGGNGSGQCGVSDRHKRRGAGTVWAPSRISGEGLGKCGGVVAAAAGRTHTLLLTRDGSVFQCGNGTAALVRLQFDTSAARAEESAAAASVAGQLPCSLAACMSSSRYKRQVAGTAPPNKRRGKQGGGTPTKGARSPIVGTSDWSSASSVPSEASGGGAQSLGGGSRRRPRKPSHDFQLHQDTGQDTHTDDPPAIGTPVRVRAALPTVPFRRISRLAARLPLPAAAALPASIRHPAGLTWYQSESWADVSPVAAPLRTASRARSHSPKDHMSSHGSDSDSDSSSSSSSSQGLSGTSFTGGGGGAVAAEAGGSWQSSGGFIGAHIVAIACGARHSVALDETGGVWTWGEEGGALGHPVRFNSDTHVPRRVAALSRSAVRCVAIAASGTGATGAVSECGDVYTWGSGAALGGGKGVQFYATPQRVPCIKGAVGLAMGGEHCMVLTCEEAPPLPPLKSAARAALVDAKRQAEAAPLPHMAHPPLLQAASAPGVLQSSGQHVKKGGLAAALRGASAGGKVIDWNAGGGSDDEASLLSTKDRQGTTAMGAGVPFRHRKGGAGGRRKGRRTPRRTRRESLDSTASHDSLGSLGSLGSDSSDQADALSPSEVLQPGHALHLLQSMRGEEGGAGGPENMPGSWKQIQQVGTAQGIPALKFLAERSVCSALDLDTLGDAVQLGVVTHGSSLLQYTGQYVARNLDAVCVMTKPAVRDVLAAYGDALRGGSWADPERIRQQAAHVADARRQAAADQEAADSADREVRHARDQASRARGASARAAADGGGAAGPRTPLPSPSMPLVEPSPEDAWSMYDYVSDDAEVPEGNGCVGGLANRHPATVQLCGALPPRHTRALQGMQPEAHDAVMRLFDALSSVAAVNIAQGWAQQVQNSTPLEGGGQGHAVATPPSAAHASAASPHGGRCTAAAAAHAGIARALGGVLSRGRAEACSRGSATPPGASAPHATGGATWGT